MISKILNILNFSSNLFNKLILIFSIIIFVSITSIGISCYIFSAKLLTSQVINNSKITLKTLNKDVNLKTTSLQYTILQILNNDLLQEFYYYNKTDSVDELFKEKKIIKELSKIQGSSEHISQLWLYSNNNQLFFIPSSILTNESFFNYIHPQLSNKSLNFQQELSSYHPLSLIGFASFNHQTRPEQSLLFMKSLPLYDENIQGQVIINTPPDFFKNLIDPSLINNALTILIANEDLTFYQVLTPHSYIPDEDLIPIITSLENSNLLIENQSTQTTINDTPYTILYEQPVGMNLKYIGLINHDILNTQVNSVKQFTYIVAILCFIFSILIAYTIVKKICHPLKQTLEYIRVIYNDSIYLNTKSITNNPPDDLDIINNFIHFTHDKNTILKAEIIESQTIFLQNLLIKLLTSNCNSSLQPYELNILNETFIYENFKIVICNYTGTNLHAFEQNIRDILSHTFSYIKNKYISYIIKKNKEIVIILNFKSDNNFSIDKSIKSLYGQLLQDNILVGYGEIIDTLDNLSKSYYKASLMIKTKLLFGNAIDISFEEISNSQYAFSIYPKEQELKLINSVKSGNDSQVHTILTSIFSKNKQSYYSCMLNTELIFIQLIFTLHRILLEINISPESIFNNQNPLTYLTSIDTLDTKEQYLLSLYDNVLNNIEVLNITKKDSIYYQIVEYIHTQYHQDISLNDIAYKLDVSASYLSILFKEKHGLNFLDYLNTYRIKISQEILDKENLSVNELSQRVGFTNVNTFIRVFKKSLGTTPGKYKSHL